MTELEPESEEDEPSELRSAAVEALQSVARQNDPKEYDRLTRYALAPPRIARRSPELGPLEPEGNVRR